MGDFIIPGAIRKIYRNKIIKLLIWGIIFSIWMYILFNHSKDIRLLLSNARINFPYLVLAGLVIFLIYLFIGTTSWWLIIKGFGQSVNWMDTSQIQLASNVGKYIPGQIWHFVGRSVMFRRLGIRAQIVGAATAIELLLSIWSGTGLALVTFHSEYIPGFAIEKEWEVLINVLGLLFLVLPLIIVLLYKPRTLLFMKSSFQIIPKYLGISFLTICIGWLFLSYSLWLQGNSLLDLPLGKFWIFCFATTSSVIVGILAFAVPGGLGVREGMIVFVLSSQYSNSVAILMAGIFRVLISLIEFLSALVIVILHKKFATSSV